MVATAARPATRKRPVAAAVDLSVDPASDPSEPIPAPAVAPVAPAVAPEPTPTPVAVPVAPVAPVAPPAPVEPPAPVMPRAPIPPVAEEPAPAPPALYPVDVRLLGSSQTGDSSYHLHWTAQEVRDYLGDKLTKIRLPARDVFGRELTHIRRYANIYVMVAEVLIYNWPYDDGPTVGEDVEQ